MEVSKMGLKILKHLKEKNDNYVLGLNSENSNISSMSHYDEIKDLFPKCSYARLNFELKSLMEQKLIFVNIEEDSSSFPSSNMLRNPKIKFSTSGKGSAYLEQRVFTLLSKYLPLSISIISLLLSIVTLLLKVFEK